MMSKAFRKVKLQLRVDYMLLKQLININKGRLQTAIS